MYVLRIEHPVPNFAGWKKAFDADPIGRRRMGVLKYRVFQPTDDPNYAAVDLEFDSQPRAEACLAALRTLWGQAGAAVMHDPRARIFAVLEEQQP